MIKNAYVNTSLSACCPTKIESPVLKLPPFSDALFFLACPHDFKNWGWEFYQVGLGGLGWTDSQSGEILHFYAFYTSHLVRTCITIFISLQFPGVIH